MRLRGAWRTFISSRALQAANGAAGPCLVGLQLRGVERLPREGVGVPGPETEVPSQLAEETALRIVHVSRALRELSGRGLVECLTPDVKARGRLYGLTPDGAALLSELNGSRRYVTPTVREAAKEGFVPKIRGSSVVRFLEYLRKTRGRGVVAEAIASWSGDADKLTEDTWLSVEACAALLEIVETNFGTAAMDPSGSSSLRR